MANDMYLKLEGIDGESTDSKHAKWIEISSYSLGATQAGSFGSGQGGLSGGRVNFTDLTVAKTVDAASPDLLLHCCNGKHIPTVTLEVCQAIGDKHCYIQYVLTDVMVTSVQPGGSTGGDKPLESVSMAFDQIKWTYTPVSQAGAAADAIDRTWSIKENKQV